MNSYKVVALIDKDGNIFFHKVDKKCLDKYVENKQKEGFIAKPINEKCFFVFEDLDFTELRFDLLEPNYEDCLDW